MFKTRIVTARHLMADDRFKMGGSMYRIADVRNNGCGEKIIDFYPVNKRFHSRSWMIVPKTAVFKIYNQK